MHALHRSFLTPPLPRLLPFSRHRQHIHVQPASCFFTGPGKHHINFQTCDSDCLWALDDAHDYLPVVENGDERHRGTLMSTFFPSCSRNHSMIVATFCSLIPALRPLFSLRAPLDLNETDVLAFWFLRILALHRPFSYARKSVQHKAGENIDSELDDPDKNHKPSGGEEPS